jgi:hypothetical protein
MTVLYKQPSETKIFDIEFADQLASGDSLSSITSVVEGTSVITIASTSITGTKVRGTYSGGVDGTTYHIVAKVVTTNGETIEVDVFLAVVNAPSSVAGSLSFFTARTRIADFLGWTRHSGNWSGDDIDRLDEIVNAGYQQFKYPEPLPGETTAHRWSFLRPKYEFDTAANTYTYDLPSTYGAPVGDMYYDEDENEKRIIEQVSPAMIDRERARDNTTGRPCKFAIRPKNVAMTAAQTKELMLYPTPDAVYGIVGYYDAGEGVPLSETNPYMLGGEAHFQTILQSCRDVAAKEYKDDAGGKEYTEFIKRLRASVEADRRLSPKTLGFNDDGRKIMHTRHGDEFRVTLTHNLGGG